MDAPIEEVAVDVDMVRVYLFFSSLLLMVRYESMLVFVLFGMGFYYGS